MLRTFAHTTDDNFPFQVRPGLVSKLATCPDTDQRAVRRFDDAASIPHRHCKCGLRSVVDEFACCWQESPGVFNEVTFRALDWLLDEVRHRSPCVVAGL